MGNSLSMRWFLAVKDEYTVPEDVTPDDLPLHLYCPDCINPASKDLHKAWCKPEPYRSCAAVEDRINSPPIAKLIYSEAASAALKHWRSQVITSIDRRIQQYRSPGKCDHLLSAISAVLKPGGVRVITTEPAATPPRIVHNEHCVLQIAELVDNILRFADRNTLLAC
jgi:hypothetical protein